MIKIKIGILKLGKLGKRHHYNSVLLNQICHLQKFIRISSILKKIYFI